MSLTEWNPDRVDEDWPGPPRPEPAAGVLFDSSEVLEREGLFDAFEVTDPAGAVPVDVVDIDTVSFRTGCWQTLTTERCVNFTVAAGPRLTPDPRSEWVAWGIVVDYTGDGRPDARFGVDNAPGETFLQPSVLPAAGQGVFIFRRRMWRAELASGETFRSVGSLEDPRVMDAETPGRIEDIGRIDDSGHIFVKKLEDESFFWFYVWASMIKDGQIVTTDYAPDTGWLSFKS